LQRAVPPASCFDGIASTRDDIPFDKLKADIKESALYSPTVMQMVRKVQNVFK